MSFQLFHGDMREILCIIPDNSIEACITDPPYDIGFMSKQWDQTRIAFDPATWRALFRVLKPGGHALIFGGTRTYHRITCAVEDAGFEIRDCIMWLYGSGFPKSLDVGKAIDKAAGAEREIIGHRGGRYNSLGTDIRGGKLIGGKPAVMPDLGNITAPATDKAQEWNGWGTALKPAYEPIILARKPLSGTVANNVITHGVGGINVDECRIETNELSEKIYNNSGQNLTWGGTYGKGTVNGNTKGRWPANVIHDSSPEVLAEFAKYGEKDSPSGKSHRQASPNIAMSGANTERYSFNRHNDTGTAARFFYTAKASRSERGEGNNHATVKPLSLIQYLCRLITPRGGIVIDPFMGSGTTGYVALGMQYNFIGIEKEKDHFDIATKRLNQAFPLLMADI
jgi:DNA modification methylase